MINIENSFQKVFISKEHNGDKLRKSGIVRSEEGGLSVELLQCPAGTGETVLASFGKEYNNGYWYGHFVTRDIYSHPNQMKLRDALIQCVIEDDMRFKDKLPTGNELEKYFSRSNFSFLYFGISCDDKIFGREIFYHGKEKQWKNLDVGMIPLCVKRFSERLRDDVTRVVVTDNDPELFERVDYISARLGVSKIKMHRIDKY